MCSEKAEANEEEIQSVWRRNTICKEKKYNLYEEEIQSEWRRNTTCKKKKVVTLHFFVNVAK